MRSARLALSLARTKKGDDVNPKVLLGGVAGAFAFLLAVTVIFDAYEKSIEQRMIAELVVQKLRHNSELERVTSAVNSLDFSGVE